MLEVMKWKQSWKQKGDYYSVEIKPGWIKRSDKLGLSCAKLSSAEATSYQLASQMRLIVSYFFCGWVGCWVAGGC